FYRVVFDEENANLFHQKKLFFLPDFFLDFFDSHNHAHPPKMVCFHFLSEDALKVNRFSNPCPSSISVFVLGSRAWMGWEAGDKVPETTGGDPAGLSEIRRVSEKEGGRSAASTCPMAKPAPPDF